MERLADALPLDRAASRWIVSSDPDEQVERIRPYVELGFTPPRLPRPRPRPGAVPQALRRAGPAAPAQGVRLTVAELISELTQSRSRRRPAAAKRDARFDGSPAPSPRGRTAGHWRNDRAADDHRPRRRADGAAGRRSRRDARRLRGTGARPRTATCWSWRRRSSRRPRAAIVDVATRRPRRQRAIALAAEVDKDPRFVEVVLSESRRIVRHRPNLMIVEHRLGFVMANAGIDHSNVAPSDGTERVLLLPLDPDASARALARAARRALPASAIAVIISDSFGRPWRRGTVGIALGAAGLPAVIDWRGQPDLFGREARSHRDRLCRRDRRRRVAGDGPGRRGDADGAGARPLLDRAGRARRRADPPAGARSVPMSDARSGARAVGRDRRRQAGARPLPRPAAGHADRRRQYRRRFRASRPLDLARSRHAALHAVRPRQPGTRLGPARRDLDLHGGARGARRRDLVQARRRRSRDPCRAHPPARAPARACRRSPTISAAASASRRGCCR